MAEKIDKKELKQPDAFQRAGLEAQSWIEGKEKMILGGVVALLAALGIWGLADYFGGRSTAKSQQALGSALRPLTRPVAESPEAAAAAPGEEKPFGTQKEKDEAILASLSKFRDEHGKGSSAATAALFMAQSQYRLGQYDDALKSYDAYLQKAPKDEPLRAVALEGQGYTWEAKGNLDEALKSYDALAANKGNDMLSGMGEFHKGRILVIQGKKDEAAKMFSEIPGTFPNSAAARMATERLNLLASQGVKVPAPAVPAKADAGVTGQAG